MARNDIAILERLSTAEEGFPRTLSINADGPRTRILLEASPSLCWFRGHFPKQPVLPGIVQLHWAILVGRALYGFESVPREIKRLKFKKVIIPPRKLELVVSRKREHEMLFSFSSQGDVNSEGHLSFMDDQ